MKTKVQSFIFHKEEVQKYAHMLGDSNPIYKNKDIARQFGFQSIPLPPTMPMTVYQFFDIPWSMQSPVILRKQQCIMHEKMYVDEKYTSFISLTDVRVRSERTFSKETLAIYNTKGILCFQAISQLISGDVL